MEVFEQSIDGEICTFGEEDAACSLLGGQLIPVADTAGRKPFAER